VTSPPKKLEESEMNDGMTGLVLVAAEDCILVRGSWKWPT